MKSRKKHDSLRLDILIFDMDGVLIDVSKSYRQTIQQTVGIYLETCLGFKKSRNQIVSKADLSLFKSIGGFNNDWDLSTGVLLYLLSISGIPPAARRVPFSSIHEAILHLKGQGSIFNLNINNILKRKRLLPFLKDAKSRGGGLKGVRQVLNASWDGWVYSSGDMRKDNLVKRIFQEVYLGGCFSSCYGLKPLLYRGPGLYRQERLLIPRKILLSLRKRLKLGIASGRPRFEAELALKRFRLASSFDSVVTLDECQQEEERLRRSTGKTIQYTKPHPYSLLRAVREISLRHPRCGYVGDVVDDMIAAQAAKREAQIHPIGFLGRPGGGRAERKALIEAGAEFLVEEPGELLQFVPQPPSSRAALQQKY